MPQAVFVTIGLALESSAGAWIVANAAALSSAAISIGAIAANAAYSADQQRKAARAQTAAYNASLKDREVMIRSAIAPRRIVYGRDKISGPIVFAQSTGAKGEFLHLVIALADGECEAIEEIYFNDILLPTPDGSGYIQSGEFAHNTTTAHSGGPYTPSSGTVTLPQAASKVVSVSRVTVANDVYTDVAVTGWAHTPGSASVTGCGVGACYVNYETSAATPRVRIKKHLGQAGQVADADLVSESGGKWTSAMVGTGVCYLYVRLEYDTDVWGQVGIPNISCVVKGRKLYDPRSATTVWSENAALIARDYLRDATNGLGAAAGEVIDAEVNAAANICDELVTLTAGGATQKRYTFNGSVTTEVSPRDNLADLLTGMAGSAVWVQGRWLLRAGAYRTPAMTITEDYLAGDGVSISANTTRASLFNAVRATYRDTAQAWAEVQAPLVENAAYQSDDGGKQLVRAISLPGAMENMRAQRLAKIELERARQALTVQLTTNLKGYDLAPTDTVALTLARYGFSAKVFEVLERVWSAEGTLQYTLRETAAGVWAWNYGEATTVDLAPNTTLPNPYAKPAAITGLGVASGTTHLMRLSDGTIITRAFCTWTASTAAFVQDGGSIELGWKRPTEADWQAAPPLPGNATSGYLQPVPDSTLILVRVRAVNAAGRPSDWATVEHAVVGKSAAPSNVAGLSAAMAEGGVLVTWTPCPDIDYAETELRYGASWAAGTQLFVGNAGRYLWPRPAPASYAIYAKHRDTSGIESAAAASYSIAVSRLTVDAGGNLLLNSSFEADIDGNGLADDWTSRNDGTTGTVSYLRIATGAVHGGYKQRLSAAGLGTASGDRVGIRQVVSVQAGADYVFSAWHGNPTGSPELCLYADWYTSAPAFISGQSNVFAVSGAMSRDSLGLTAPATAAYAHVYLFMQANASGPSLATLDIDAVQFAQGTALTGYAPRPDDILSLSVDTNQLASRAATAGAIYDTSTTTGSSGSPGASGVAGFFVGPTIVTAAEDELDFEISGLHTQSYWSQAAMVKVQIWIVWNDGGSDTEFATRRKFFSPVDVYSVDNIFAIDFKCQFVPGAVTRTYKLKYLMSYIDAAGSAKTCAKDYSAVAQWAIVRRKR